MITPTDALREPLSRPGGRSARVQASVHQAVQALLEEMPREQLTIALVATRAGVTPSTLYRRWGDLPQLLADVALNRIRPWEPSADTGTLRNDLHAWVEQFVEEMGSAPGRAMVRDVLGANTTDPGRPACQCADITRAQLALLADRAHQRGEAVPDLDLLLDRVVAPVIYRILYATPPSAAYGRKLVDALWDDAPLLQLVNTSKK